MRSIRLTVTMTVILVFILGVFTPALAQETIIEVTPTEYDFGNVTVGDSATAIFTIQNTNGHYLTIWDVSLSVGSDPDFAITDMDVPPTVLSWDVLNTTEVEVTFTPQTAIAKTAVLVIVSDDAGNPLVEVPLSGRGIGFEYSPKSLDFGQVEVGDSSTMTVTVTSTLGTHSIVSASMIPSSDPEFYIVSVDTGDLLEGQSGDVVVGFAPSAVGEFSGEAAVIVLNLGYTFVTVPLTGEGVDFEPDPEEEIAEILDFIDMSVDAGTLEGTGNGNSPEHRLNALINMIEAAGDLIEAGEIDAACGQLMAAYKKCDGQPRPPDFVAGEALEELAQMILDLMASLGC